MRDAVPFWHVISMINGEATLCSFKCMISRKKEEVDPRYLPKARGTDGRGTHYFCDSLTIGWVV